MLKRTFFHQSDVKRRITIRNVDTLILESNKILSKTTINSKQVTPC